MSGRTQRTGGTLIPLRVPAQTIWDTVHEIRALFPRWDVFYNERTKTWNAWRQDEHPDFGHSADGCCFMVSTYDAEGLVVLLEGQVLFNIGVEFPGCQVRRARPGGGWYATYHDPAGGRGAVVWLVNEPAIADLQTTLRALAHQTACLRRRP